MVMAAAAVCDHVKVGKVRIRNMIDCGQNKAPAHGFNAKSGFNGC